MSIQHSRRTSNSFLVLLVTDQDYSNTPTRILHKPSTKKLGTVVFFLLVLLGSISSYCSAFPTTHHDRITKQRTIRGGRSVQTAKQHQQYQQHQQRKRLTQSLSDSKNDRSRKQGKGGGCSGKGGRRSRKSRNVSSSPTCNKQSSSAPSMLSKVPSKQPSLSPSLLSQVPTQQPSQKPSAFPTSSPPSSFPTRNSSRPSSSSLPSLRPTSVPSEDPSYTPSLTSTLLPTTQPTPKNLTNSNNPTDPTRPVIYVNQTVVTLSNPVPPTTPIHPCGLTNFWLILFGLVSLFLFAITIGCFGALLCFISRKGVSISVLPITDSSKKEAFQSRSLGLPTTIICTHPLTTPPSVPSPPSRPTTPTPSPTSPDDCSRRSLSEIESNMSGSNIVEDDAPVNTSLLENIVGINDWDAIVDDSHHA